MMIEVLEASKHIIQIDNKVSKEGQGTATQVGNKVVFRIHGQKVFLVIIKLQDKLTTVA